ncbi:MAG: FkbM family methyltransferase [Gammaproteobacteria bacterium]|nr:FkbM family methyltransferase [Gammaproteobacteria bacterium]
MSNNNSDLHDWPEEGIRAAISFICNQSSNDNKLSVVDVGGHQGETLGAFAKNVARFSYLSFEPNPTSFAALQEYANTLSSVDRDIDLRNAAVGAENGRIEFHVTQATAVAGVLKPVEGLSERVPTRDHEIAQSIDCQLCKIDSLDAMLNGDVIDLLKIDTEGYDLEVMKGAKQALENGQFRAVLSEVFFVPYRQDQAFFWDLALFMENIGYHFVNLYDCRDTAQGRLYTGNGLWLSPQLAADSNFL